MGFLRILILLCLAVAVPALIAITAKATPAASSPHLIMLPAARIWLHSHSEEQPLALIRSAEQPLG